MANCSLRSIGTCGRLISVGPTIKILATGPPEESRGAKSNTSMTTAIKSLTQRPAWKALQAHYEKCQALHLRKLFSRDPKRGERMTAEGVGLFLDYSKNRVTDQTLKLL